MKVEVAESAETLAAALFVVVFTFYIVDLKGYSFPDAPACRTASSAKICLFFFPPRLLPQDSLSSVFPLTFSLVSSSVVLCGSTLSLFRNSVGSCCASSPPSAARLQASDSATAPPTDRLPVVSLSTFLVLTQNFFFSSFVFLRCRFGITSSPASVQSTNGPLSCSWLCGSPCPSGKDS